MARLPSVGGDNGNWGQILNDYLSTSHNADGTLKDNIITAAKIAPSAAIMKSQLSTDVQASLDNADAAATGTVPDATSIVKGKIQLAGDLAGTATSPAVAVGSISATKLADSAVVTAKLQDNAVTDAKLAGGISQTKITNLANDLAGKANTSHTHSGADITAGTIATARLGSGTPNSSTYLRGDGAWAAMAGGSDAPAQVLDGGNLGSAHTLDVANAARTQFHAVITANLVLTIEDIPAGGEIILLLTQDGVGSHTVQINFDGDTQQLDVATTGGADSVIYLHSPDAANLYISGGLPAEGGSSVLLSTVQAKGDLLVGTADDTVSRLPVGTNGQVLTVDSTQSAGVRWTSTSAGGNGSSDYEYGVFPWRASGVLAENMPRNLASSTAPVAITSNGTLRVFPAVKLKAGVAYSGIQFTSQTTAAAAPTMQWACLLSYPARTVLAVSPDYTTTAWGSGQTRTFTFNTPYTPSADQLVFGGLCITATTHPTLLVVGGAALLVGSGHSDQLSGNTTTSLTAPMTVGQTAGSFSAATSGALFSVPYLALV